MSTVRLLVGTRKGAFMLTADGGRRHWEIQGPLCGGWEIFHFRGSPADPNRLYAPQSSAWFGQLIERSDDGGRSWRAVGNEFCYEGEAGTHQWYDGTAHPFECKRLWHLAPSPSDPDVLYAGIEDAALFQSTDGGSLGASSPACAATARVPDGNPGREVSVCTLSCSTRRAGAHLGRRLRRRCVPQRRLGSHLAPHQSRALLRLPARSRGRDRPLRPPHRARRPARPAQPDRRPRLGAAHKRPPSARLLRERAARGDGARLARALGVYFGTTGGQIYASADAGDHWRAIVRELPPVLSVEAQTLP